MKTTSTALLVIATAMLVVVAAGPCLAQTTAAPQGPSTAGQPTAKPKGPQTFDATASLTAAFDNDLSAGAVDVSQLFGPEVIAHSNQLQTTAEYRWAARDIQIRASGASAWLHDRQSGIVAGLSRSGAAGLTARLPRRTTLTFNQSAVASNSNLYNLFPRAAASPGTVPPAVHDYGANNLDWYTYSSQATLTHDATRRVSFTLGAIGEFAETARRNTPVDRSTTAASPEQRSYGMSGRFARTLTRNTRAMTQYSYRAGLFPGTNVAVGEVRPGDRIRTAEHTVEFGFAHTRAMSASRRTIFDVTVGGVVVRPLDQPLIGPFRLTDSYRLLGQASGAYLFRKTWQLGAMYRRGVDYIPGLTEPVLTDGLTANLGGSFTRRLEASVAVGYASGVPVLKVTGPRFDSYTSDVKLRLAVGQSLSLYGEYLYYLYDFRRYAFLVPGMPPALERNGLRVGLTVFMPTLDW